MSTWRSSVQMTCSWKQPKVDGKELSLLQRSRSCNRKRCGYAVGVAKRAVIAGSEMKKGYEKRKQRFWIFFLFGFLILFFIFFVPLLLLPEKDRSAAKKRLNRMRSAKVKRGIKKVAGKTARLAQKGASAVSKLR